MLGYFFSSKDGATTLSVGHTAIQILGVVLTVLGVAAVAAILGEALIVVIAAAGGIVAAVIEGISLTNAIFTAPNPALNLAPFGRWTLRDRAAHRPLAQRWASNTIRM